MLLNTLLQLFERDLSKLYTEIDSYQTESNLWVISDGISNSGGNLCLHLLGNLNTYVGATLGNSGYVRDRPLEFSSKNIPKMQLLENITQLKKVVESTLQKLENSDLVKIYPENVLGFEMTTEYFLIHLTAHLSYHLGQINYHRRLFDKE